MLHGGSRVPIVVPVEQIGVIDDRKIKLPQPDSYFVMARGRVTIDIRDVVDPNL